MGVVCFRNNRWSDDKPVCYKDYEELYIHYVKLFYKEVFIINETLVGLNRFKVAY